MATGTQAKTKFVFAPINGKGGSAASRKFIKAHAMNEALRQRLAGIKLSGSENPLSYQTGRFRVSDSPSRVETKLIKVHSGRRPKKSKHDATREPADTESCLDQHELNPTKCLRFHKHHLTPAPSPGRIDPFDALPIKVGQRQEVLLSYYSFSEIDKSSFVQNTLAFNSDKKLLSLAVSDPAWLHATLAIVALSLGLSSGVRDGLSLAALFHRGQALLIVNERLRDSPAQILDTTLGAIASLSNFEMTIGSLDTATAHMKGLQQLLRTRGWEGEHGLPTQLGFLRKLLAWSDLCYAGVTLNKPHIKSIESSTQTSSILVERHLNEPSSFESEDAQVKLPDILNQLRLLSRLMDRGHLSATEQAHFSSAIFATQYQLTTFHGNGLFKTNDWPNPYLASIYYHESATCLALCTYINIVLRLLPPNAALHCIMAGHLRSSLERSGDDLVFAWSSNLSLLLWILFMGATATAGRSECFYFVRNLALVGRKLQLSEFGDFTELLRATIWSDTFYSRQSIAIWEETSRMLSMPTS